MKIRKKKVIVALSGGVDSALSAALLKKKGYEVKGVFMRQYDIDLVGEMKKIVECTQGQDRRDAARVADTLDIPFEEWDFRSLYGKNVIAYLLNGYSEGKTPNPDVMCNTTIKFGAFLERALREGADAIATGHYVKKFTVHSSQFTVLYRLCIARDTNKDQSYFLYTLTQKQLAHCLFPLGTLLKSEVRVLARHLGLPVWDKKDSQGVCFVGKISMKDFLKSRIAMRSGALITVEGEVLGEHAGAAGYTIGQRHGLGFQGGGEPCYVVERDVEKNIVVVARGENNPSLFRSELTCSDMRWISGEKKKLSFRCTARIRYRQPLQHCSVTGTHVRFDAPQRAITSGQAIVFYQGNEVLGGGVIT